MKGIAFTLDAIFALIIASASISILLYFQFLPQTPYVLKVVDAENLLNLLSTTNISSLSSSSPIAYAMVNQQAGGLAGWDNPSSQVSGQLSSSYGPRSPFVASIFFAGNTITTGIVADYGDLYFGAGNSLYALNKTGRMVWVNTTIGAPSGTSGPVYVTPLLYDSQVIYWGAGKIVDLNANNGSVVWTSTALSSSVPAAQPIAYDGKLVFTTASHNMYVMYANNGTIESTNAIGVNTPISTVIAGGSIAVLTSNNLNLFTNAPGVSAQGLLWSNAIAGADTNLVSAGNVLLLGESGTSNALFYYMNGTSLATPLAGSQPIGTAASGNTAVFQGSTTISAFSLAGNQIWQTIASLVSPLYGNAYGAPPVIAQGTVYSLWSGNYLLAQNLSTGAVRWSTKIPYPNIHPSMTIAYGRLYIAAGNTLLAYGSCNQNAQASILQAAVSLYLSGQGSCADYLLNSVEPQSNYSLAKGNTLLSSLSLASFAASNSYIISGSNYSALSGMTISFWAYPTVGTGSQEDMIDSIPRYWMVGIVPGNDIVMNTGTSIGVTTTNAIPFKAWSFITLTTQTSGATTIYSLYINGNMVNTGLVVQNMQAIDWLMFSNATNPYNGLLANVQIYGAPLNNQNIGLLYQEGIQGGPLKNADLLSWYPLDGDANDYGNQSNTGYPINVAYVNGNYVPKGLLDAYEIGKASSLVSVQNYSTGTPNLYNIGVEAWR